jgi:peptidoglycan/LPS O-acetylase OafA/YrhL
MLVGTVLHPESWFGRLLETRPMRLVGQLSYSLYLWQQAFLVWAPWNVPFLRIPQRFPVNILAAFATACLSHYLVEKPLIRLGRRVVARFSPAMVKSNCAEPTACETVGR